VEGARENQTALSFDDVCFCAWFQFNFFVGVPEGSWSKQGGLWVRMEEASATDGV
jgi:hypothetical protein